MSDEEDDIFKKKKPSKKQKQQQQQQQQEQGKEQLQAIQSKKVIYCGICTLPLEFCQYSKHPQQCAIWLKTNHNDIYEQYYKEEKQENQEQKQEQKPQQEQQGEQKPKKTKKVKVKESEIVYIKVKQRQKNKFITQITGLEKHNIDIKEAQKKFSKKFGCGAHIQENNIIELQGDLSFELEELLPKEYPSITEDMIEIKEK